ncbi:MAG: chemotaxis protein CheA, partial [Candidatus Neomarinimicrobiota bacterium]
VYDNLVGMEEVLDEFIVETTELLEAVNEDLVHLESDPDNELVNRIFRAFHTFKGTCGFLGFDQAKDLAHVAEDILNQLRNGKLEPNGEIIDNLLAASDWFGQFINDVKEREEKVYEIDPLIEKLEAARGDGAGKAKAPAAAEAEDGAATNDKSAEVEAAATDGAPEAEETDAGNGEAGVAEAYGEQIEGLLEKIEKDLAAANQQITTENASNLREQFLALDEICSNNNLPSLATLMEHSKEYLLAVEEGKLHASTDGNVTIIEILHWVHELLEDGDGQTLTDLHNQTLLDDLADLARGDVEPNGAMSKQGEGAAKDGKVSKSTETIRVDMERLENLMNLAGELVLSRNQLGQAYTNLTAIKTSDASLDNLDQVNNSLGRITTEIQEAVMQMRMLPISNVFRKFPRVMRDLARDKGKQVELTLVGEETELDRSVIESIKDPLLHLVRNAVDHGIEAPDVRKAKGKPEIGTVILSAAHEGNHIVIEILDDGAGMDAEKLVSKALETGVISTMEADNMSTRDKLNLIFRPGFSLAEKVTDVSGRGVGMDVVSTNISKLNGAIDIETKVGIGSRITIKLPLTLAIVTGLKVAVWDEEYIIPFGSIIETVKLDQSALTKVEDKWVIRFRESVINTLYLDEWFNVNSEEKNGDQEYYAVVVSVAEFRYALVVTGLKGQEEAVIKPLGQVLGRIPGIAGGTIGGDGRITLILDVPELVHQMGLG